MSTSDGRLSDAEKNKPVRMDAPNQQVKAIMSQLDDVVAGLKVLCAKLDADVGVTDTNYAALVSDLITKITLKP